MTISELIKSPSMPVFLQSLAVALALTTLTYFVGMQVGWISELNWLEAFAVFTSYSCTYMCVFQSRWNYPMGVITTFIYSWFYWTAKPEPAYALAIFNLYMVFSLMFGYWRWGPDGKPIAVSKVHKDLKIWLLYVLYGAFIGLLLGVAIDHGAKITNLEIIIVILSGVAQLLLDNKRLETWYVWIGVNIASIYFYYDSGWYLVMFQYIFFLANTLWGLYNWKKDLRGPETNGDLVGRQVITG